MHVARSIVTDPVSDLTSPSLWWLRPAGNASRMKMVATLVNGLLLWLISADRSHHFSRVYVIS